MLKFFFGIAPECFSTLEDQVQSASVYTTQAKGNSFGVAEHTKSIGLGSWKHFAFSVGISGGRRREGKPYS